jgi:hypothetical protein
MFTHLLHNLLVLEFVLQNEFNIITTKEHAITVAYSSASPSLPEIFYFAFETKINNLLQMLGPDILFLNS